jgi:hypothetical protein
MSQRRHSIVKSPLLPLQIVPAGLADPANAPREVGMCPIVDPSYPGVKDVQLIADDREPSGEASPASRFHLGDCHHRGNLGTDIASSCHEVWVGKSDRGRVCRRQRTSQVVGEL